MILNWNRDLTIRQIQILINDDDMDPTILFDESHLIGDGSGSDYNFPFSGYYEDERTQILYKAEELMGAGLIQGHINKLGINVSQKYSSAPFNNFTVKLKQVNMCRHSLWQIHWGKASSVMAMHQQENGYRAKSVVLDLLRKHQMMSQDTDIQELIRKMTR